MKLLARRALAFLAFSPLLLTVTGCANQAEGERCDIMNGDADCEPGLICKTVYVSGYHQICCPLGQATVATCNASGVPPPDGGTSDGGTRADAAADTSDAAGDPVSEVSDDRSTIDIRSDTRADVAPDLGADSTPVDVQREATPGDAPDDAATEDASPDSADDTTSTDAPSLDTAPDLPTDTAVEASIDAPADTTTPIDSIPPIDAADVVDAPSGDGPG